MPLTVLLFYKYVRIDDPVVLRDEQRLLCASLDLKGRIIVAAEGINGTVAGTLEAAAKYQGVILSDPRFAGMEFKISSGSSETFPRLSIKARKEIVTLGLVEDVDAHQGGEHLTPDQWKRMIESDPEVVLFDARNRYESDVGRFKGAIAPEIENFRELPAALPQYQQLKDKKVLMYCTGGIRCEKASALLRREGFQHVYQLHGGILNYLREFNGDHWEGECFVFDQRMTDPAARPADLVGRCAHTGRPTDHFINCLHDPCHRLLLVDESAVRENPNYQLCPACLAAGLTWESSDYVGSPARASLPPKPRKPRRKKRALDSKPHSA